MSRFPRSVFVYELITGGGLYALPDSPAPSGSLLREGSAMLAAVVEDFAALGIEVSTLRDARLPASVLPRTRQEMVEDVAQERPAFEKAARQADTVLVIAPEFDGLLLQRVRWAENCTDCLLSPSADFVEVASCKYASYLRWRDAGVPTIETHRLTDLAAWAHLCDVAVVTKPMDGAGSENLFCWNRGREIPPATHRQEKMLIQPKMVGMPVSCALLGSGSDFVVVATGHQRLDRNFKFIGGVIPLPEPLAERAERLARQAAGMLPPFRGYAGIDMILGPCPEGSDDVAVEVNPRLTSSYIGLRRHLRNNLVQAMLDVAVGRGFQRKIAQPSVEYEVF